MATSDFDPATSDPRPTAVGIGPATTAGADGYTPAAALPGTAAGWWSRVGATVLDGVIVFVPLFLAGIIVVVNNRLAVALALAYLVAVLLYAPVLLTVNEGRTWGKQALGIRVVRMDGSSVHFGRAFARETLKGLFGLTGILWIIDVLWPLRQHEQRAWHDLATDTRVVRDTKTRG
jgi:uncharacterized RDD family membrane protein YckC